MVPESEYDPQRIVLGTSNDGMLKLIVCSQKIAHRPTSSQAKGTNSTSFLTHVRNEVELVPLACEDDRPIRRGYGRESG